MVAVGLIFTKKARLPIFDLDSCKQVFPSSSGLSLTTALLVDNVHRDHLLIAITVVYLPFLNWELSNL